MARKLLMNNYAENGLMPVMDGLVCWLDGRDYIENSGIWKDRTSNCNDFNLTHRHFSRSNGVYFNYLGIMRTINGLNSKNKLTLEIGYNVLTDNNSGGFFSLDDKTTSGNSNSIFGVLASSTKFVEIRNNNAGLTRVDNLKTNTLYKQTFVCSGDKTFIYDGLSLVKSTKDNNNIGNTLRLGMNKANRLNNVIIYYVRVYNRALAEDEIKQNYQYEQLIKRGE